MQILFHCITTQPTYKQCNVWKHPVGLCIGCLVIIFKQIHCHYRRMRCSNVFSRVYLCVWLSVCLNALTFESLDTESSFRCADTPYRDIQVKFIHQDYRVKIKVVVAKQRVCVYAVCWWTVFDRKTILFKVFNVKGTKGAKIKNGEKLT